MYYPNNTMTAKIDKNRQKRGRPSKKKQNDIKEKCREQYERYHTSGFASQVLELNRHTVEKYYREFQETEVEDTNEEFVLRQRSAKNRVLTRLDEILFKLDKQLRDLEGVLEDDTKGENHDIARYEAMRTTVLKSLSDILQQKASIETTPTLDITIEKYIEETYGQHISEKVAKPQ